MRLRLFKMGTEGKVAVANLALMSAALLVFLITFPNAEVKYDSASEGELLVARAVGIIVAVLAFPVGWVSAILGGVSDPPVTAVIFVPLNAYMWGYVVAAFLRWRKARRSQSSSPGEEPSGRTE